MDLAELRFTEDRCAHRLARNLPAGSRAADAPVGCTRLRLGRYRPGYPGHPAAARRSLHHYEGHRELMRQQFRLHTLTVLVGFVALLRQIHKVILW